MKTMTISLLSIGALAGVFCLCRFFIWRWAAYEGGKYDERQVADQDKAGKVAFGVLMSYLAVIQILRMLDVQFTVEQYDSLLWVGILLGIAVFGTFAIWTNAYNLYRKNWKPVTIILLVLAVWHLADFLDIGYVYRDGTCWYVGQVLTQSGVFVHVEFWVKLVVGLVWLYLALLIFVRRKLDERE